MNVEIPKGSMGDDDPCPCWIPVVSRDGQHLKPVIRCRCGIYCGIGLHHVHADGTVTASFYHKKGPAGSPDHSSPDGCEWHVGLKLMGYDWGDFPPA
jgi:hypothetical protein